MATMIEPTIGRPRRVLHVLEATLGGTRRYLEAIGDANRVLGAEMGLVYATGRADPQFAGALENLESGGWATFKVEMPRELNPGRDFQTIVEMRRILREWRPDVIHCHSSKAGGVGRIAAATVHDRPAVLYSPHALAANLGRKYLMIERWLAGWTDLQVAVSHSEAREIADAGLAGEKDVAIVYLNISATEFAPRSKAAARRELGLDDVPLVLGIGRLSYQKDPAEFVEVIRQVRESVPDVHGLWVGDGELRRETEQAIEAAGLAGCVTIQGWEVDVRPFIAAADLLLSTSRYEGFSYVPVESLSMGRLVVGSAITGTTDLLAGELSDQLYPHGRPSAAAERIVELLGDAALTADLADLGMALVRRRFSPEAMADSLDRTYSRAIGLRDGTPT